MISVPFLFLTNNVNHEKQPEFFVGQRFIPTN